MLELETAASEVVRSEDNYRNTRKKLKLNESGDLSIKPFGSPEKKKEEEVGKKRPGNG